MTEAIQKLWDAGKDSLEIAQELNVPEWRVYNILSALRREKYAVKRCRE